MWPLCLISTSHAREPCLSRITQNSVCSHFKFGYLSRCVKKIIHSHKHGTKVDIRSTKMAINRHAYNRDVLQSYWTSNGLPLYCSQPTGEKIHTDQQCERLAKTRQTTGNLWSWRQGIAAFWLDGCHSQPVPYSNNTGCPIDVCQQEQLETVWNQLTLNQRESLNVHCWQTDIDEHVWHGV